MSVEAGLQIAPGAVDAQLRPDQKRFNGLVAQIARARGTLAAWQETIPLYWQAHARSVAPLAQAVDAARRARAFALEALLLQPGWSRAESATLQALVCDAAGELLDACDGGDAELKALFDRHAEVDFDTERQRLRDTWKRMAEAVTGIDLGDIDAVASDAELLRQVHERMAARDASPEAGAGAGSPDGAPAGRRPRRKSAAQLRREEEGQQATQSVRAVYRRLASALHPDRETDPAQRAAKTALMQDVNKAHAAGDLLALLELQLRIEQIDAVHIADAGAERLRHYNKVLAAQLARLKAEVERTENDFRHESGLDFGWGLQPARVLGFVGEVGASLRAELQALQRETRRHADRAALRRWLKAEQRRLRDGVADGGPR